jgi:malonate transporter and related proteins
MIAVASALVPVFLLMIVGLLIKLTILKNEAQWIGVERIVYYVLFPALLIDTLARADLSQVPVFGVGGAMFLSVITMSALCLGLRPWLTRSFALSGPSFTSFFQAATRWQTFVALALAANLYGNTGLALASVAMVAMIPLLNVVNVAVLAHYASSGPTPWHKMLATLARNPFIWSCAVGLAINLLHIPLPGVLMTTIEAIGRASLALGLIAVGAGLHLEGLFRLHVPALLAVTLKLLAMPALAIGFGYAFGLQEMSLAVIAICSSVPTASNAYILARQMGGDAPLLAQILTLQTAAAVLTMPPIIALAASL